METSQQTIKITIAFTTLCNYKCEYCFADNSNCKKENLDIDACIAFIKKLITKYQDYNITLVCLGGETCMNHQLKNFCTSLAEYKNIDIVICTNGSFSEDFYIDIAKTNNNVYYIFSWHAIEDNKQNLLFIKKMYTLMFDKKFSKFEILVSAEPNNFENSLHAFKILKHILKNIHIEFNMLKSTKNYKVNYTIAQLCQFQYLQQTYDFNCFCIDKKTKQLLIINDIIKNNAFNYKGCKCDAGKTYLFISTDGNIYRCYSYYLANIIIGNIVDINIDTLLTKECTICNMDQCSLDLTYSNKYKET